MYVLQCCLRHTRPVGAPVLPEGGSLALSHSRASMLSGMFDRILIQNELFKREASFVNLVLFLRLRERALAILLFPRLGLAQLM